MVICLVRGADLHMVQRIPLPLTVSCFSKIQTGFTFLVPAHPGSLGQRAVERVCVCVCVVFYDWPLQHMWVAKNVAYFPFNSWVSFQQLCRLLWGFLLHTTNRKNHIAYLFVPLPMTLKTLKVIRLMQDLLNAIRRTLARHLARL